MIAGAEYGNLGVIKLLLEDGDVELEVECGTYYKEKDSNLGTALHAAEKEGCEEIIDVLL